MEKIRIILPKSLQIESGGFLKALQITGKASMIMPANSIIYFDEYNLCNCIDFDHYQNQ